MPVIQISEIVHRRGAKSSLPNLAEAEIGLSLDTSEVFIGTPNFPQAQARSAANQAPFANTQILTEFSPNVEQLINYTYRYRQPNGPSSGAATPLATNSQRIFRLLQERLDEVVSVKSYGALGNGFLDFASVASLRTALTVNDPQAIQKETYAIRRAAIDVTNTLNDDTVPDGWIKRALYFPAGVYVIEDYAVLPPNSAWIGDGEGQTFIVLASATNANIPVVQTANSDLTVTDLQNGLIDNFVGANILSHVENVHVHGITFIHAWSQDVARLIKLKDSSFTNCGFKNFDQVIKNLPANWVESDSISVMIDTGAGNMIPPENVLFDNCSFANSTYAVFATADSSNITFESCTFDGHYRAIRLGETLLAPSRLSNPSIIAPSVIRGPSSYRIHNSLFRNCFAEAFSILTENNVGQVLNDYVGVGGFHVSTNNRYENCGNGSRLPEIVLPPPQAPVVLFAAGSVYNSSISDTFDRNSPAVLVTEERVAYTIGDPNIIFNTQDTVYYPGISSSSSVLVANILANQLAPVNFAPAISFAAANTVMFFDYSYEVDGFIRMGTLQIVSDGTTVNFTNNSTSVGITDPVVLSVVMSGPNFQIQYTNSNPTEAGLLKYTIRIWNAVI